MCYTAVFLSALYGLFTWMPSAQVLYMFFATPQARFFSVLGSCGLQCGHGAVPSVTARGPQAKLFASPVPCCVSALSLAKVLRLGAWGRGEVFPCMRDGQVGIYDSLENKLFPGLMPSHLLPELFGLFSPGPQTTG